MSILHHIVWALVNSVWQSAILAAIVFVSMRFVRRSTAAQRYAIWASVLLACALLPALDLALSESWIVARAALPPVAYEISLRAIPASSAQQMNAGMASGERDLQPRGARFQAGGVAPVRPAQQPSFAPTAQASSPFPAVAAFAAALLSGRYDMAVLFVWLLTTNLLIARLVVGYQRLCQVKQQLRYRDLTTLECETFERITSRPVAVGYSGAIGEPCVIGFSRPVIALPIALSATLSPDDVTRVMRHECAHIGRWDDYLNLVKQIVTALLFFNPVVSYLSRTLDIDREIACDDAVALAEADRIAFAKCLYEIAHSSTSQKWIPATGLIRGKRHLAIRIRQLLDSDHSGSTRLGSFAKLAALAVIVSALPVAFVQLSATGSQVHAVGVAPCQAATCARRHVVKARPVIRAIATIRHTAVIRAAVERPKPARLAVEPAMAAAAAELTRARSITKVQLLSVQRLLNDARVVKLEQVELLGSQATHEVAVVHVADAMAVAVSTAHSAHAANARTSHRDEFLQELRESGFTDVSVDQLVAMCNAGVSARFVRQLHAAGLTPMPPAKLIAFSDNGVDAAFVAGTIKAGYGDLSTDELIELSNSGVTTAFLQALTSLGYRPSVAQTMNLANAGVDQHYITSLVAAGLPNLTVNDLVRLSNNGVTGHYIEALAHVGYTNLSVDDLIRLSNNGVTATFIARLEADGVNNARHLSVDDLIKLYNAGI